MKKLILKNYQSPGDILMLTAAVRDLHRCYPNQFLTDVRTSCPELWNDNPYLTPITDKDRTASVIDCEYPLIHKSNEIKLHFLYGFIEFLNNKLKLDIVLSEFSGDIHLSSAERAKPSQVEEMIGTNVPYWVVAAGGKYDFTIKWWESRRYQSVVNYFRDTVAFVQIGEQGHFHPPLEGVIDLRGKTSIRELIRLVFHADGVICPVTFLMHLAAALPPRILNQERSAIIIAGGREPEHWEAYPNHDFLHTIGQLPCCRLGGCWRSRAIPLGDGEIHDQSLCVNLVGNLPRCMDMIAPEHVIKAIERKILSGQTRRLKPKERTKYAGACRQNEWKEFSRPYQS